MLKAMALLNRAPLHCLKPLANFRSSTLTVSSIEALALLTLPGAVLPRHWVCILLHYFRSEAGAFALLSVAVSLGEP